MMAVGIVLLLGAYFSDEYVLRNHPKLSQLWFAVPGLIGFSLMVCSALIWIWKNLP